MSFDWDVVGPILALVSAIVGASTVYLRLYVGKELLQMKQLILELVQGQFASKDALGVMGERIEARATVERVLTLERRIELLETAAFSPSGRSKRPDKGP